MMDDPPRNRKTRRDRRPMPRTHTQSCMSPVPVRRRHLLRLSGISTTLSLAGCIGSCFEFSSSPRDAVIAAEQIPRPTGPSNVIVFADLPADEREIIEQALTDGVYRACRPDIPDAAWSFGRRIRSRSTADTEVYLTDDSSYYSLFVRVEDVIFSEASSTRPERTQTCC